MYTYTYKSINAVNVYRDSVTLECAGAHKYYMEIETDTRTLANVVGLMFTFPVVIAVDSDENVEINGRPFGRFKRLSLKSK